MALDASFPTKAIADGTVDERPKPCSEKKSRNKPALRRECKLSLQTCLKVCVHKDSRERGAKSLLDNNVADHTLVVPEELVW